MNECQTFQKSRNHLFEGLIKFFFNVEKSKNNWKSSVYVTKELKIINICDDETYDARLT